MLLGVCSVWFRSVFMGMANQNWIFGCVKFSTKTDRNGWKSIGFDRFSVFQRESYWERFLTNIVKTQTLFSTQNTKQHLISTQNTKQHIKNHKTQTKISSYKVSLKQSQNSWNPSTSMGDLGWEKQNKKQTSQDDTKPMESQYKHGWFGMRETKSRRMHTIARNEEIESVQAWVIWDERQNQEEDIP